MQYKTFKDEAQLSRLGMGVMRFPQQTEMMQRLIMRKQKSLLRTVWSKELIIMIQPTSIMGVSLKNFWGRLRKNIHENSFYIADKYNFQAQPDYRKQFQEQLTRLNMDRIDFYLLHGIQDTFAEQMIGNGCISYFEQMKKEGKIKYLGFSFHGTAKLLKELLKLYSWDFVQFS